MKTKHLIANATAIVASYLGRNQVVAADIPKLIQSVFSAVAEVGQTTEQAALPDALEPAVPVRRSVGDDYIICLEDGVKVKMLKRYIASRFGLTPDAYRAKWKLPASYPMVAPAYARMRSDMAKRIGLGTRPDTPRGRRKRTV
jgi:predicted transcriptional regulator